MEHATIDQLDTAKEIEDLQLDLKYVSRLLEFREYELRLIRVRARRLELALGCQELTSEEVYRAA